MWPRQDTLWCALEVHPEEFHPACTCRLPCTSSTVAPRHTSWHVRRKVGSPGYLFGFADQGHQKMLFFSCSLLGCARLENDVDIMWYNWVHPLELAMVMNQLHIRYTSIGILGSGNLKVESVHFCWLSLSGNNQKKSPTTNPKEIQVADGLPQQGISLRQLASFGRSEILQNAIQVAGRDRLLQQRREVMSEVTVLLL